MPRATTIQLQTRRVESPNIRNPQPVHKQSNRSTAERKTHSMEPDIPVVTGVYAAEVPTAPMAPPQPPAELSATARKILQDQGYTEGLLEALETNKLAFLSSIWVVDNSGSMQTRDGQRIVEKRGGFTFVQSSRWQEMQQTVDYHCQMASLLQTPTTFRMLNDPGRVAGPQVFSIGTVNPDQDLAVAQTTMDNAQPAGVT